MKKTSSLQTSCDVVHFFIDLFVIDIFFDLYLSVGSESIETNHLTYKGLLINKWITEKRKKQ